MAWYLAPSLSVLRDEVNARWGQRDKTSDGTIGDAAHQATRSDHNPNERESVDAWDMDKDGVDVNEVIAAFQKHPSAHYWIWQRQIADRDDGWRRRPYSGTNPHDRHAHFSIYQTRAAEQDTRPWGLLEDDMTPAQEKKLDAVLARLTAIEQMTDTVITSWSSTNPKAVEQVKVVQVLKSLGAAVAGVDEATKAQLRADLNELDAAVAAIPAQTVEALGDLDAPEEIADRLRAALGDKAPAVGALLVQG